MTGEVPERIAHMIVSLHAHWDWLGTQQIADMVTVAFCTKVTEATVVRVLEARRAERREGSAA